MSYTYYPTGSVKTVRLGNSITIDYTYHISGAVKTASAKSADGSNLFKEELFYEDCGGNNCVPQYNGNISRMIHQMAVDAGKKRDSKYVYDFMNRLESVDDSEQDLFDEYFAYDAQGRITVQRRGSNFRNGWGGDYTYYKNSNKLEKVNQNIGDFATSKRNMNVNGNFVYDSEGNLIEDKSKSLKISYDWRGMPVEFVHDVSDAKDAYKLLMAYDGSGRRISKTRMVKDDQRGYWYTDYVTHYTGIGTEVREVMRRSASPKTDVVVNMPQGLGRFGVEDASTSDIGFGAGYIPSTKFEWYLKNHQGESSENDLDHFHCRAAGFYAMRLNHLGSTMLVYGTQSTSRPDIFDQGGVQAAYDYRAFGEQVDLEQKGDKVTENFTGKERDDETELNYFGARYLDPMLGLWTSVDPKRQFASPYLYVGNGYNPVNGVDPDGNYYEDGERCSDGLYVPADVNQGTVSPGELDDLVAAERNFMASPGNVETLMSVAKYSLENDVETRYWYDGNGQNNFGVGNQNSVLAGMGKGEYIHVHTWRARGLFWDKDRYNYTNEGLSEPDVNWSRSNGSMMALELRTGNIYYTNKFLPYQYRIMQIPAGKINDATPFNGKMEYAVEK